mmetsp:Transcript_38820/g.62560  ORF Transcript_38820/g.62560 Transcript_38820/m.62560 type:complete len:189 (+) Transcript_38820:3-569(+)
MPKSAQAVYDPKYGWNAPARVQQERAWCEVVHKEKRIQGVNEKKNREIEDSGRRRGHRWPGGPACGAEAASAPRAPYFEDGDIWRSELLKRQPLKADPRGNQQTAGKEQLTRMGTRDIVDLKRRTEEELEKRSWSKALANLNTVELGDLSSAIGDKLEARHQRSRFTAGGGAGMHKPHTPPLAPRSQR